MWSNGVGQNKETDEEHDEDCIEVGFQLARIKYDRDSEGSSEALGVGHLVIQVGVNLIQEKQFIL